MRILQVVTYISPDGAYGGPVRVALNQAKALTERGHDVIVAGSAGGFDGSLPTRYDDFPVRVFPARRIIPRTGFAGLFSPDLLAWMPRALRCADIVHVHVSRDLVTLPVALMARRMKIPLVLQTHGMIDETNKLLARPLDAVMTVPALRGASVIFHLTQQEKDDLEKVAGVDISTAPLTNGVAVPDTPALEQVSGPKSEPEVICLARVHPIKRPLSFIRAGIALGKEWPAARFTLVGPDEGEGDKVRLAIRQSNQEDQIAWPGPISPESTSDRLRRASIFVLPSKSELFSMSTLEAMALGLPVVITATSGLAPIIRNANAGIVCDESQESLNRAIGYLLENPEIRIEMGRNGRILIAEQFSTRVIAATLEDRYLSLISEKQ